jgi:hypothetical protein
MTKNSFYQHIELPDKPMDFIREKNTASSTLSRDELV